MSNLPKQDAAHHAEQSEAPQTFEQLSPEVQQRLRTAARILATGAIRVATKQAQTAGSGCSSDSS